MTNEKWVLKFPQNRVQEPIVFHLVKDHGLKPSILRATISPDEGGLMVLQVEGARDQLRSGRAYLISLGVSVEPLSKDVRWIESRCVHCTACISVCPTQALAIDRKTMTVSFDKKKCIACELCIPVCIYDAMKIAV